MMDPDIGELVKRLRERVSNSDVTRLNSLYRSADDMLFTEAAAALERLTGTGEAVASEDDHRHPENIIGAAYQIVASLAHDAGFFEHPEVQRALDFLAWEDHRDEDLLPWPRTALAASPAPESEENGGVAVIENDSIVIRVPIAHLPQAFDASPLTPRDVEAHALYHVTDPATFAKGVVRYLNDEEEDGSTAVHRAFDQAMIDALENGEEGLSDRAAPTVQETKL